MAIGTQATQYRIITMINSTLRPVVLTGVKISSLPKHIAPMITPLLTAKRHQKRNVPKVYYIRPKLMILRVSLILLAFSSIKDYSINLELIAYRFGIYDTNKNGTNTFLSIYAYMQGQGLSGVTGCVAGSHLAITCETTLSITPVMIGIKNSKTSIPFVRFLRSIFFRNRAFNCRIVSILASCQKPANNSYYSPFSPGCEELVIYCIIFLKYL